MMKFFNASAFLGFHTNIAGLLVCAGLALIAPTAHGQTQTGGLGCAIGGYVGSFQSGPDRVPYDVLVHGNYAYVLEYNPDLPFTLTTLEITDPASPVVRSTVSIGDVNGMEIEGDVLYLTVVDEPGVHLFDISNPAEPSENGSIEIPADFNQFEVRGDRMYYLDSDGVVRIVDIADPSVPVELGIIGEPDGTQYHFSAEGDRIYLTRSGYMLEAYDISEPAAPVLVAMYEHNGARSAKLSIGEDLLLVHGNSSRVGVFILDPGGQELVQLPDILPYQLADGLRFPQSDYVHVQNDVLTYGDEEGAVVRVSLADPESPELLGITATASFNWAFDLTDNGFLFAASEGLGISVLDMNEAGTVQPMSDEWNAHLNIDGFQIFNGLEATIEDEILYAAIYYEEFKGRGDYEELTLAAIDVSDPANPIHLSTYFAGLGPVSHIETQGSTVFAARDDFGVSESGLEVIDFSDPTSPSRILLYTAFPEISDMGLDAGVLWMQVAWNAYVLLDVSDVHDIQTIGYYKHHVEEISATAMRDGNLYISCVVEQNDGVLVPTVSEVNLADPLRPVRHDYSAPTLFSHMKIQDDVLYALGDRDYRFYTAGIFDLNQYGSQYANSASPPEVVIVGEHAYIALDQGTLSVYDVSDPLHPSLEGLLPGLSSGWVRPLYDDGVMMLIHEESTRAIDFTQGCSGLCLADLSGDGVVNFFDVTAFIAAYSSDDLSVDFDGDGSLNFVDVSLFLEAFGQGCP